MQTQILVMRGKEVIGTLVAVDPDVQLARELGEALGDGWQLIEVSEPVDSCCAGPLDFS